MGTNRVGKWICTEYDMLDLDAVKARDLIVECFYHAQRETFFKQRMNLRVDTSDAMVRRSVVGAVRSALSEVGGSFETPTQATLKEAVEVLARKAASWGTPEEVVLHHKNQVCRMIDRLQG